jgi:hypothetical protein
MCLFNRTFVATLLKFVPDPNNRDIKFSALVLQGLSAKSMAFKLDEKCLLKDPQTAT